MKTQGKHACQSMFYFTKCYENEGISIVLQKSDQEFQTFMHELLF